MGVELTGRWTAEHYHQPSDEYTPDLDLSGAVQQARLIFALGYDLASTDFTPEWLEGSPFQAARDGQRP